MTRHIGGFSLEGRYFIVRVPEDWKEMDALPDASPDDLWFDRVSAFKAALDGPWIRKPVRRSMWTSDDQSIPAPPSDKPHAVEEYRLDSSSPARPVRSRSLGDLAESAGGRREIASRLGQQ